jgi:hypothetical protein
MNITKEQADKVIAALEIAKATLIEYGDWWPVGEPIAIVDCAEALSIMRGLADAEPVAYSSPEHCERFPFCGCFSGCDDDDTSPQAAQTEADELLRKWNLDPDLYRTDSGALNHMKIAAALKHPDDYPHTAQTAVKSESLAQAAQAPARLPGEGKTIEALALTEAQERELFEAWFYAETDGCTDEEMELMFVAWKAGRAGSKP